MDSITGYTTTEHIAKYGNNEILVREFQPIFANDDEKRRARQTVEEGLFRIFSKYVPCTA